MIQTIFGGSAAICIIGLAVTALGWGNNDFVAHATVWSGLTAVVLGVVLKQ